MIALLVAGRIATRVGHDNIIFQFGHRLETHASDLSKTAACLGQNLLRRTLHGLAIPVEIGTEQRHRGQGGKGVQEGSPELGQHIEVTAASLNEGEEAGAIHTLAVGEDGLEIVETVDDKVERLQPTVMGRIHEVDHLDIMLTDKADDVAFCQFRGRFAGKCDNRIGT